jgi:hypothetical protein
MRKGCLVALTLFVLAVVAVLVWDDRTGRITHANYERIRPGMALAEVERLLGGPGTEMPESEVPRYGSKPAVTGDRFFRWEGNYNGRIIIVSLRNDVVAEKDYSELSL